MTNLAWFGFGVVVATIVYCVTALVLIKYVWPMDDIKEEPKAPAVSVTLSDGTTKELTGYKMPVNSPFSLSVKDVTENTRPATEPPTSREAPESIRRMLRR